MALAAARAEQSSDRSPGQASPAALVVDDQPTNRLILRVRLKQMGFAVHEANDGAQAIECFKARRPDIVFMDVMMPVMDGLEATRRIKAACGEDEFVPVIFLTAVTDEEQLARCMEAGGDDFLSKPFSHQILEAKVRALGRVRDLNRRVATLYGRLRHDEEIAEQVFSGAVTAGNVAFDGLRHVLRPASTFSGDVLLTARAPSGDVHVLLGDFTGHGLSAALGALPVSEVFRAMTAKGFSIEQIIEGVNAKLHALLPTGMFMAVQFACIDHTLRHLSVCNCGMPDAVLIDGASARIQHRFASRGMALGITADFHAAQAVERRPLGADDHLLLASDGLSEAVSPSGELFGEQRYEQALARAGGNTWALDVVLDSLDSFTGGTPQPDDVSLVEIACVAELLCAAPETLPGHANPAVSADTTTGAQAHQGEWEARLMLAGPRLAALDPVPVLMGQLQELQGLAAHRSALFTILTELYVNALDHGVLGLDSSLKQSGDGFLRYMQERESGLAALRAGQVCISLRAEPRGNAGRLVIRVEDSGSGFEFARLGECARPGAQPALHGRGLHLVRELCVSLSHEPPGNTVEAVYAWSD